MYIHEERKLIYLANPKTASIATGKTLIEQAGFRQYRNSEGTHHYGPKGITLGELGAFDFDVEGYSIAATVRNHWDTLISWWFQKNRKTPFGRKWIENDLFRGYSSRRYFPIPNTLFALHAVNADTILRYETLNSDLCRWLGHDIELISANVSEGRKKMPYEAFYDKETRLHVKERFGEEIGLYGYVYQ